LSIDLTGKINDADGDSLTVTITSVTRGTATVLGNIINYSAPIDSAKLTACYTNGDLITYKVSDGYLTAVATITISYTNVPQTIQNYAYETRWNQSLSTLKVNCTNTFGDTINYGVAAGSNGNTQILSDGTFKYTIKSPKTYTYNVILGDKNSVSETISYTCSDATGLTSTGTIKVTIYNNIPRAIAGKKKNKFIKK
jgi:hypothetical protein